MLLVKRPRDDRSARVDDHRIARVVPGLEVGEQLGTLRESLRDVLAAHRAARAEHPAPSFGRDVPHRRDPGLALVPRWRDIDLAALREKCETHQRHVVFPADQTADAPHRRFANPESRSVAHPPQHSLRVGRHQLAVPVEDAPVRADEDRGVVEGAAAELAVALVDAHRHGDLEPSCRRLDRFQVARLQVDRVLDQAAVDLAGELVVAARTKSP